MILSHKNIISLKSLNCFFASSTEYISFSHEKFALVKNIGHTSEISFFCISLCATLNAIFL